MKIIFYAFFTLILHPIWLIGQIQNNGNFRMHSESNIGIFGNFSNDGNFINNLGMLHIVGSNVQIFNGSSTIQVQDITINKLSNSLHLDNILQIAGTLAFIRGSILTDHADIDSEFVEFLDNATYTGENDTSHIAGVIRKTGNDAFVFPTGNNSLLRTISITAPSIITDHFTTYYIEDNPDGLHSGSSIGEGLNHVSACEYWILNRTAGNSNVAVTLSWDSNSCGVDNLCDLRVSRWDGVQWVSEGNGGITGTLLSGTLVSGTNCSSPEPITNFSPFTLGSLTSDNPLPISLISFEAILCESSVCLKWQTASEINNDFFTVEKSNDGKIWKGFETINGAENSYSILEYKTIDKSPFLGYSYYRLKQTDFNGEFEYSSVERVYFDNYIEKAFTIYPNPANKTITIKGLSSEVKNIKIYNLIGQDVSSSVMIVKSSNTNLQLDISLLKPGIYHVKTTKTYSSIIKQ